MNVLTSGSLSMIIYSKGFVVDCSSDDAARENSNGHRVRVRRVKRGRMRVGRVEGGRGDADDDDDEPEEELDVEMGSER